MIKTLQAGVAKSGNYWLYNIIQELYKTKYDIFPSYIKSHSEYENLKSHKLSYDNQVDIDTIAFNNKKLWFYVSSIFKEEITNNNVYFDKTSVVWTHSELNNGFNKIIHHLDKVVYIIRDPRDVFNSKINFAFSDYSQKYLKKRNDINKFRRNRLHTSVINWNSHVIKALKQKEKYPDKIHIVFYETLLENPFLEIKNLSIFLGFNISSKLISNIVDSTSANKLRLKDKGHVSKNIYLYKWKNTLDENEKKTFISRSGFLLSYLGYPIKDDDFKLPRLTKISIKKTNYQYKLFLIRSIFSFKLIKSIIFSDRDISEIFNKLLNTLKK